MSYYALSTDGSKLLKLPSDRARAEELAKSHGATRMFSAPDDWTPEQVVSAIKGQSPERSPGIGESFVKGMGTSLTASGARAAGRALGVSKPTGTASETPEPSLKETLSNAWSMFTKHPATTTAFLAGNVLADLPLELATSAVGGEAAKALNLARAVKALGKLTESSRTLRALELPARTIANPAVAKGAAYAGAQSAAQQYADTGKVSADKALQSAGAGAALSLVPSLPSALTQASKVGEKIGSRIAGRAPVTHEYAQAAQRVMRELGTDLLPEQYSGEHRVSDFLIKNFSRKTTNEKINRQAKAFTKRINELAGVPAENASLSSLRNAHETTGREIGDILERSGTIPPFVANSDLVSAIQAGAKPESMSFLGIYAAKHGIDMPELTPSVRKKLDNFIATGGDAKDWSKINKLLYDEQKSAGRQDRFIDASAIGDLRDALLSDLRNRVETKLGRDWVERYDQARKLYSRQSRLLDYHDEVGVPAGDLTYDPEKLANLMTKGTSRSRMAEPDPMLTLAEDAATVGIVSPYTLESRARERLKPKIVTRYGLAEGLLPGAAGGLAGVSIYELLRHLPFLEHVALPVAAGTAVISPSIISGYHGLPAMWQNPLIRAADVLARKGLTPLVGKSVGQEQ